jgi:ERCC4-related helicase
VYFEHPLIRKQCIQLREYQEELAKRASRSSTLLVLPTGLGKTVVAAMTIAYVLQRKGGKVLFLAPTRPLVEQHHRTLTDMIEGKRIGVMTGEVDPLERELVFLENDIVVSTPQVVGNDLKNGRMDLKDVKLLIFDEAHRAVGNYAYVDVAKEYMAYDGLVLGMTASPGSEKGKIKEVCQNLNIKEIEVRTEKDPDVAKYVQAIHMDWVEVELPQEMRKLAAAVELMYQQYIKELVDLGVVDKDRVMNKRYLLEAAATWQARLRGGEKSRVLYKAISVQAKAVKMEHALDLVETQGMSSLRAYLERMKDEAASDAGSKAGRDIVSSTGFQQIWDMAWAVKAEHPKLSRVMGVVAWQLTESPSSKVLVFTHYRDTCELVANKLSKVEGAKVAKLVGQSDRKGEKGQRQKEQVGVLERFRQGEFNVLVATSVGEEGLDVASTDLVVFYEPVPSEIRSIQRRGRTGRSRAGKVVILITKDTRDEAYYYSSLNKEKAMRKRLEHMKDELAEDMPPIRPDQRTLGDF